MFTDERKNFFFEPVILLKKNAFFIPGEKRRSTKFVQTVSLEIPAPRRTISGVLSTAVDPRIGQIFMNVSIGNIWPPFYWHGNHLSQNFMAVVLVVRGTF